MTELPDYTVAQIPDGLVVVKVGGEWWNYDDPSGVVATSDDGLWERCPYAEVVALPTTAPLSRDEAQAEHAFNMAPDPSIPMNLLAKSMARRERYRRGPQ